MSWHFLQGQEAASWVESCLDGAPSALLKLMPTAAACCLPDSAMGVCQPFRSGTMCERSTANHGQGVCRLSAADFLAPTLAPQAMGQESPERQADFGWKWPGSLAKYVHSSRSWKTRQYSLVADSTEFSGTWPRWGLMRDGELLEQMPAACLTREKESGLLPTPSGVNAGKNHTMGRIDEWGGSSNPLRGTVIGSLCLPEFEEMVMGWPVMWTALTQFGMDRFHAWQQAHGEF